MNITNLVSGGKTYSTQAMAENKIKSALSTMGVGGVDIAYCIVQFEGRWMPVVLPSQDEMQYAMALIRVGFSVVRR